MNAQQDWSEPATSASFERDTHILNIILSCIVWSFGVLLVAGLF